MSAADLAWPNAVSIWARIAQLTAKRGLNDAEIALPLGAIERYAIRLKNTDVEPLPDYYFS
jgi:hypothetical protein